MRQTSNPRSRAAPPADAAARLKAWVAEGKHGDMAWMAETLARRADPQALWNQAASIVVLGVNYGPQEDPREALGRRASGAISTYARRRDYHDVIKGRMKQLAGWIAAQKFDESAALKVFVDTAPVMEKPLAQQAGLGWQGKHTNLVSREFGSWLFLGSIFTTLDLPADPPETDHCGACRACLDACPTQAFDGPYRLDARRCVSYLTIEHKGPIPVALRAGIGNRIFGCDDCLAACPWNKFAKIAHEAKLTERGDLAQVPLESLAALDEPAFRALFAATPVKRVGHKRFLRNVLVALGNSGRGDLAPAAAARLDDADPVVRGAAVWALSRLLAPSAFAQIRQARFARETDPDVGLEWGSADSADPTA